MSTRSNKYFWEECARLILLNLCGNEFLDLQNSDRPDLCNSQWGIEVTRALTTEEGKISKLSDDVMGKASHDLSSHEQDRLKSYNIRTHELNGKIAAFCWPPQIISDNKVTDSFTRKLDRLNNGNYRFSTNYGLFIFTNIECFGENEINQLMLKLHVLQEKCEIKFSRVFISCIFNIFWHCDLVLKIHSDIDLQKHAKLFTDTIVPQAEQYCKKRSGH